MFRRLKFIIGQLFGTSYTVVLAQDLISGWIQAGLGTTSIFSCPLTERSGRFIPADGGGGVDLFLKLSQHCDISISLYHMIALFIGYL